MNQWKLTALKVKNIFLTDESVKRKITDLTSENLTDSDLESTLRDSMTVFNDKFIADLQLCIFWISVERAAIQ